MTKLDDLRGCGGQGGSIDAWLRDAGAWQRNPDPQLERLIYQQAARFSDFVTRMIQQAHLYTDESGAAVDIDADKFQYPDDQLLVALWNTIAPRWASVETMSTYVTTMYTLLAFINRDPKRPERIASLGSGPGLYETFLGGLWQDQLGPKKTELVCVDAAAEMTKVHQRVLRLARTPTDKPITTVVPVTQSMTSLEYPNRYFDQLICNNSLQWVIEWEKAIAEMARVTNPQRAGWLYLFANLNPMRLVTVAERHVALPDFDKDQLLDALEQHGFKIDRVRLMESREGLGQNKGQAARIFVKAKRTDEPFISWRNAQVKAHASGITSTGIRL